MPIPFHTDPVTTMPNQAGRCMYAKIDELRKIGPAVPVSLPDGMTAWSVVRGDIVAQLLTHPHVSRDVNKAVPSYIPGEVPWLAPWADLQNMTTKDGDEHSRLRRVVVPSLTNRKVQQLRPAIERISRELLHGLADNDPDVVIDVHAEYSYQIPTLVICDLLGLPHDQRPEVLRVFRLVARTDLSPQEADQVHLDLHTAMRTLIATKRSHPGDDLTSVLIAESDKEHDPLSEDELVATLLLMIGGGSQTTINLIDHALADVSEHSQLRRIAADRSNNSRNIIEESLRKDCPVMNLPMRWALEDIDLGMNTIIKAGEPILLNYGGHGRDPDTNSEPERFDIDREHRQHLAFGLGAHRCPGSQLAILEAEIAVSEFFHAFPHASTAGDIDASAGPTFIGNDLLRLPMRLGERNA
ncbi:cytochrome P450 [Rhodococcus sp. IEGM 1330]|uniref:cytochrome P450 n=1 Tax=Rhodococcus sp. IEGM 1330 TaxID=3082225 RepID=UPI0029532F48|nr:cytochrome P450 [Rhodococcus sp. IEGM 1330]MDV8022656.1 cytochrome P450 [Rhodococcus sp. IEGM 1330]